MKDSIRKILNENITKSDVKDEYKKFMKTSEFEAKIEKIIKDKIKNEKYLEDKVVEITKNVLTQLYKTLWVKRGMVINSLKNKKA